MTKQQEVKYLKTRRIGILSSFTVGEIENTATKATIACALMTVDGRLQKLNE